MANTHMAASTAMMTWSALEWAFPPTAPFFTGRPTSIGAACGAVVGLVAITPACGYVAIGFGMLIALIAAVCVFFAQRNIKWLGVDDRLDVFAFHGVAGMVGTSLTGLFATTGADSPVNGAFYSSHGKQFAIQLAGVATTVLLCSVGTTVIYHVLALAARALGDSMRISDAVEDIDASQHGESAYYYDEGSVSRRLGLLGAAAAGAAELRPAAGATSHVSIGS